MYSTLELGLKSLANGLPERQRTTWKVGTFTFLSILPPNVLNIDDIHYPILTVAQTLQFALSLKSPGRRLPEQTRAQLNDEILDMLLSMLNITHTRNTVVGNEFMRGVSGGERKRVSIAEMMVRRFYLAAGYMLTCP
jgi:hypothetical protein